MGQKEQASAPLNVAALQLIRGGFADSPLTQVELARASGIPRSTLANILSPTANPRLIHVEQLVKIAVALGVDPRTWIGELESLERKRVGAGAVPLKGRRPARESPAPKVQKRAARGRASKPGTGKEK